MSRLRSRTTIGRSYIRPRLHAHHEFEDENLWDRLSGRAPACALHIDPMKDQHATMLVHLQELDAALPAWRSGGRTSAALPMQEALAGVNAALAAHFPDEEVHIVPVMERVPQSVVAAQLAGLAPLMTARPSAHFG